MFVTAASWVGRFSLVGMRFVSLNLARLWVGRVLLVAALACDVSAEGGVRHGRVVFIDEAFPDVPGGDVGVGVEYRVDVLKQPVQCVGLADGFLAGLGCWCGQCLADGAAVDLEPAGQGADGYVGFVCCVTDLGEQFGLFALSAVTLVG